jgi:uncharacterized membrane protein YbhN (UPF0104 family)
MLVAAYAVRAARWLLWDPTSSYAESAKAILVGFMGNNVLPARLGELLRADWTAGRSDAAFARTSILASIGAERVFDGLSISLLALGGLAIASVDPAFEKPLVLLAGAFGCLAGLTTLSVLYQARIRQLLERINSLFPGHLTTFERFKCSMGSPG